jgi:hypothetical protein
MNLFTLHALILYLQFILLIVIVILSRRLLAESQGRTRAILIFIVVITSFALLIWILCFWLLLLPDQADWLMVGLAEYIYLANSFLFLCAALALSLMRNRLPRISPLRQKTLTNSNSNSWSGYWSWIDKWRQWSRRRWGTVAVAPRVLRAKR